MCQSLTAMEILEFEENFRQLMAMQAAQDEILDKNEEKAREKL